MKAFTKFLAGGLGLAAMAAAAPAAAQYYPGYPGGGYGYPGGGGNVINTILGQILGGQNYGNNDRNAIEQCVRAVEYRINTRGLDNEGGRYQQYGYGSGYNNGYGNGYAGARVTSVSNVQRRSNGGLKVYGYATTNGAYGAGGYGQYGGQYGYPNQGYGYPNQGYGYPNQGYATAMAPRAMRSSTAPSTATAGSPTSTPSAAATPVTVTAATNKSWAGARERAPA